MGTYVFAAIFVGAKSLQLSRAGCEHQNGQMHWDNTPQKTTFFGGKNL